MLSMYIIFTFTLTFTFNYPFFTRYPLKMAKRVVMALCKYVTSLSPFNILASINSSCSIRIVLLTAELFKYVFNSGRKEHGIYQSGTCAYSSTRIYLRTSLSLVSCPSQAA